MKVRHSLRFRIIASFTLSGFLMGFVFGGIVYGYIHNVEDAVIENVLRMEADAFLDMLAKNPAARPPRTVRLSGYLGQAGMPTDLREKIAGKPVGIYELEGELHAFVREAPGRDDYFYLIHRDNDIEPFEDTYLTRILLAALIVVTVLAGWFGHFIANRMIAPVVNLARRVERLEPTGEPVRIEGGFYRDEVGSLATAFQQAMDRVADFVERERRFTRDASHELRTPVTVIKGAAELIERNATAARPVDGHLRRLNRAVKDMENIIETFLYLGRQGSLPNREGETWLGDVLRNLIEANRYLIEEKPVALHLDMSEDFAVQAPDPVVRIAVGNLVRNACQYTDQGEVRIKATPTRVEIQDTGRGMTEDQVAQVVEREVRGDESSGFGLGLSIVKDFCERYGWRLTIKSQKDKGTTVRLDFT